MSLADTLPDLKIAFQSLENLISGIRHYRGIFGLDISSMALRTAEGIFKTFYNCVDYLVYYFNYIDQMDLLNMAKIKTLNCHSVDGYFGHLTEKTIQPFYIPPSVLPLSLSNSLFLLSTLTVMEFKWSV